MLLTSIRFRANDARVCWACRTWAKAITEHLVQCRETKQTKLVYVLTTPVPTIGGNASSFPSHVANADVVQYNAAASKIMDASNINVIDMYSFMNAHCGVNYETCDWSGGTGNVHPSALGFQALALKMFTAIKALAA